MSREEQLAKAFVKWCDAQGCRVRIVSTTVMSSDAMMPQTQFELLFVDTRPKRADKAAGK